MPTPSPRQAALALVLIALLQSLYNTTLPLSGDEAYYWVWAKTLQAGYHDHPPGIAVLIAITTGLLGDGVFAVRLVAVACTAGAAWFIGAIAAEVYDRRTGMLALGLAVMLPAAAAGFTLATPDAPLLLFWAAGAYFARRAVAGDGLWRDFLLAGLAIGCGMASKYTAVLLPAAIAVFVLVRRRDLLASKRTWAAVLVAALAFAPVVWWNWRHGFESFAFQYRHGGGEATAIRWGSAADFIGGLGLLLSPVVFLLLCARVALWREWWRDDRRTFLMACFLLPAVFLLYKALFAKIQLNWGAPAIVTAVPLVADFIVARNLRRTAIAAAAVALLVSALIKWPLAFGLSGKLNPHNRLHGPETAAIAVEELRRPGDSIFADHLQRASLLRFYLSGHPRVAIPTESRFSEYSRWDSDLDFRTMHGLYLGEGDKLAELRQVFGSAVLVREVVAEREGFRTERYNLYRVGTGG